MHLLIAVLIAVLIAFLLDFGYFAQKTLIGFGSLNYFAIEMEY
jgi:hypothetical protein